MAVTEIMQVAVRATDLDRAESFYRDILELEYVARFDPPGLLFFRVGSTRVLLESGAPPATLYYQVPDLNAHCEALRRKGVKLTSPPHKIFSDESGQFGDKGVEEWMAFCTDPEGNSVGFVERRHG